MGTYFHGTQEIQQDGLQTLYLMNPGFIGFSDAPPPPPPASANMAFLNSTATLLNPMSLSHNPQPIIGIPLHSHDANRPSPSVIRPSVNLSSSYQGLSLSLSPQRNQFGMYPPPHAENLTAEISPAPVPSNGAVGGVRSVLMDSKYLKAAQQLLDEVAHVGEGLKAKAAKGVVDSLNRATTIIDGEHGDGSKRGDELTTAERLEIQKKKAKLVSMLDEVEQRYKQYNHQMQMVVSSFEAAAGFGSARAYTDLALQTISKQFRCLRDAIADQIRVTSRILGEDDRFVVSRSQSSRLRFVDHHLRQQRALQQLGMIQHKAWRPQRGLPEKAVSVLRAWLFEHFLHPYPKDSDKHMLAKQTGLTRSQVSNWFINARVRLWKPMVEEMYLEETKAKEEQTNIGEKTSISNGVNEEEPMSKSNARLAHAGSMITPSIEDEEGAENRPNHNRCEDGEDLIQPKMKKARIDLESLDHNQEILMSFGDAREGAEGHNGYSFLASSVNHGGGFEAYSFDHQQFSTTPRLSGNSVSLTLGLPLCEGLSLSGEPPVYLSSERIPLAGRLEGGEYCSLNNISPAARSSNVYEDISINSRKRFSAHMLQDFVA